MGDKRLEVAKEGKSEATQTRLHVRIQERLNQKWLKKTTEIVQTCKSHATNFFKLFYVRKKLLLHLQW